MEERQINPYFVHNWIVSEIDYSRISTVTRLIKIREHTTRMILKHYFKKNKNKNENITSEKLNRDGEG